MAITQDDKDEFKALIDEIIDDLGQVVTLKLPPKVDSCPNCFWDSQNKRSSNRYDSSNPNTLNGPLHKIFVNGTPCPICSGRGVLRTANDVEIIATIFRRPKEIEQIAKEIGRMPRNLLKIKAKIGALTDIKRAEKVEIGGIIYRKIMQEITQGLGEDQYVKCFLEQEQP